MNETRPTRPYRRGVCYDVGHSFGGSSTRPELDPSVVHRELEIIRRDLHCNCVRICGTDLDRISLAAAEALSLGLEAWLCPELFGSGEAATLGCVRNAARTAEALRRQWPGRVVLSVGTELPWFMTGILTASSVTDRMTAPGCWEQFHGTDAAARLNGFLARAAEAARDAFGGLVTYAAAPVEPVDWNMFDLVCLDVYRDAVNGKIIGDLLEPAFAHGKDVVISGVGCCTYRGAADYGGMGWQIIDFSARPPRLNGDYVRDEAMQASELTEVLGLLEGCGVHGIFVMTFVSPTLIHSANPRTDLDMASFSLVKSYQDRTGASYPDLHWEPKQAFGAVAEYFAPRTS